MAKVNGIDYSSWANQQAKEIAQKVDKDGVKGLQGTEVFNFTKEAKSNNIDKAEVFELLGLNISKTRAGSSSAVREKSEEFNKAIEFYNSKDDNYWRHSVTTKAEMNLTERISKMEQDINKAYIDCAAFNDPDIMVVRNSFYRYWTYPRFYDRLINFDVDEIRTRTTKDMDSLNEIKDRVEHIIKDANGETDYETQQKTEYDVDAIAKKHLGMSYEEFASKYAKELEQCKYVTYADMHNMDSTMAYVYDRAKAYAAEMLQTTILEAHNVHWDIRERILYTSLDASSDVYTVSEFEWDGITDEGLNEIKTGLMYKSFEDALIDKYKEENPTGINDVKTETQAKKPRKVTVNGMVLIFHPDGSVYDLSGRRIK